MNHRGKIEEIKKTLPESHKKIKQIVEHKDDTIYLTPCCVRIWHKAVLWWRPSTNRFSWAAGAKILDPIGISQIGCLTWGGDPMRPTCHSTQIHATWRGREDEDDSDSNWCWCALNDLQSLGKKTGEIGNEMKNQHHPDYSMDEIDQNTQKNRGVAVCPLNDHQPALE